MVRLHLAILAIAALSISQTEALKCWSCSSDMEAPCADHFNVTKNMQDIRYGYNREVQYKDCEPFSPNYPYSQNQKVVCMKKKQTTYGRTSYIRQCRYLHADEKVGTCPTESTSTSTTIDFCEYCDYDGCNGASNMQTTLFLTIMVPLVSYFFVRK